MSSVRFLIARRWQYAFIGVVLIGLAAGFAVDMAGALVATLLVATFAAVTLWLDRRVRIERRRVSALERTFIDLEGRIAALNVRADGHDERLDASERAQAQYSARIENNAAGVAASMSARDQFSARIENNAAGIAAGMSAPDRFATRLEQNELAVAALGGRVEDSISAGEKRRQELGAAVDDLTLRASRLEGSATAVGPLRLTPLRKTPVDPVVSVIVTCSDPRRLSACLESISVQDFDDFECIVVGVGSVDSEVIDGAVAALSDPRFDVWPAPGHVGQAAARNSAVATAIGEYCVVMSSHDQFHQGSLRRRLEDSWAWDQREAGATCAWDFAGSAGDDARSRSEAVLDLVCSGSVPHLPIAAMMLKTEVIKAIGGFNESLGNDVDQEFLARLLRHRFRLRHIDHLGVRVGHFVDGPDPAGLASTAALEAKIEEYLDRQLRSDEIGDVDHAVLVAPIREYRSDLEQTQRLISLLALASLRGDAHDVGDILGRFPGTIDLLPNGCLDVSGVVDKALDRFAWTNGGRPSAEAAALHHRVRRYVEQLRSEAAERRVTHGDPGTDRDTDGSVSGVGTLTWCGDEWSRVNDVRGSEPPVAQR